ncbi:globin domain-containing protein [Paenibacillus agricola]|uniref:Globin n=1 Tax=Paenibacillus agricola TaxID=2716264 RepID=A0ABX0JF27_9BACL|nr:globin [Paenibacillus agricola]NHN33492.1 globin [Paenibacillus agricola]
MAEQQDKQPPVTFFEAIGGTETIRRIVEAFYPLVQAHPLLGPIFPENIDPVMAKQILFLTQFFGGPTLYTDKYGHPMMRARHMPFEITPERAEAWLSCMKQAVESTDLAPELQDFMLERLKGPAHHFVNTNA